MLRLMVPSGRNVLLFSAVRMLKAPVSNLFATLCHGRKTKIPRLWEANGRKHSGFLKSSSSPPGSMMPRFSTLICSLLKFLLKYTPKSNAIYYISLQRRRQKRRMGFVVVDTAIIEMRPCFYFMKPRREIH